jgi:protein O-GlcNAc transferase
MSRNIGHAVELYQAGRRDEAAEICHELIGDQPGNSDALHLLGIIAQQRGNLKAALSLLDQAIVHQPSAPHYHGGRGAILQRQGRLEEALEAFEQALQIKPDYALAHFNRGIVLQQRGRLEEALDAFEQALRIQPRLAQAHVNRGVLLERRARLEEALEAFDQALRIDPGYAQAHFNRGVVLERQGRLEEAVAAYDQALRAEPDSVEAHINRGAVLERLGRPEQALEAFDQALRIKPGLAQAHFNRGRTLKVLQRFGEAIAAYEEALRLKPDYAEACSALGVVLQKQGRLEAALAAYGRALGLKQGHAETHLGRGIVLQQRGQHEEALEAYDQALSIKPDCVEAHVNRGVILRRQWRLNEALTAYDHALRLDPNNATAHGNRGSALACQGRLPEAFAAYEQALRIDPNCPEAQSNRLFYLNFDPSLDEVALSAAHREWGLRYEDHAKAFTTYSNRRDADKALRVGLVSADFGRHPVGYFLEPLLAAADPAGVQFVCYSARVRDDDLTERLRAHAQGWHSASGLSDPELAETVRADGIDILLDLAGHTAGHRLGCFALRPAPVQVHWAGYCHSVPLMDYSLWDPIQVPDGDERWFVEPVVRLPDLRWCYGPPDYAPPVTEPPALQRGYVTFGSFNNLVKVNGHVIGLWACVLREVPDSRLLLSWPTLHDAHERDRLRSLFATHGVPAERVELRRGAPSHAGVLGEYGDVDIALDPFPFSGCLTTCEALWMGVPVVTLPRTRPASRQSQAFLTALGRSEWVAKDPPDYVHIAVGLASDRVRLAALRRAQRALIAASPVCDGQRFARHFEAALRSMWRSWCACAR